MLTAWQAAFCAYCINLCVNQVFQLVVTLSFVLITRCAPVTAGVGLPWYSSWSLSVLSLLE